MVATCAISALSLTGRAEAAQAATAPPQVGDEMEGVVEPGAQKASQNAHNQAEKAPFQENYEIFFRMVEFVQ